MLLYVLIFAVGLLKIHLGVQYDHFDCATMTRSMVQLLVHHTRSQTMARIYLLFSTYGYHSVPQALHHKILVRVSSRSGTVNYAIPQRKIYTVHNFNATSTHPSPTLGGKHFD